VDVKPIIYGSLDEDEIPPDAYGTIEATFVGVHYFPSGTNMDRRQARRWARRTGNRFYMRDSGSRKRVTLWMPADAYTFPAGTISVSDCYYHKP
jgi:hypothetical protein